MARRIQRDLDALARVFDQLAPRLLLLATHLVHDVNTAEDLVSEALTADLDFEEAASCPISRSRRKVSLQATKPRAPFALRGLLELDDG